MLRIGTLGAAKITPPALIEPANKLTDVEVTTVAARSIDRAAEFAETHHIPEVVNSYERLVNSPEIDAVYNPLPISEHHAWTMAALNAGKHVLCEKPFAINAVQATEMVNTAREKNLKLMEAFHYRYHPLFEEVLNLLREGEIGKILEVKALFTVPIPDLSDIRHQRPLGGGALYDLGCYPVHWIRSVMGSEPEVTYAECDVEHDVDVSTSAELLFQDDVLAYLHCSMKQDVKFRARLTVVGEDGELDVVNPLAPHAGHELRIIHGSNTKTLKIPGRSTYEHQLIVFRDWLAGGDTPVTTGDDIIGNMTTIDKIYEMGGLPTSTAK